MLVAGSCASSPPQAVSKERFDFVGLSLDLAAGEVRRAGQPPLALTDCGNAALHCLTSSEFELVIPRRCEELLAGLAYRAGRASSKLLWVDDFSGFIHGPSHYYWFGSTRNPDVVFGYTVERGVTQIVFAPRGGDLAAVTEAGQLQTRLTTTHDFVSRGRETPEPMWRCEQGPAGQADK